jgi:hypothetical protein
MPMVVNRYAKPSNLAVVLRAVKQAFHARGDTTTVMVGEHYAKNPQGLGSPPFVILVPEPGGKLKIGDAYETGRAAGHKHVCDVIVRAAETGDDIDRLANVYAINDIVAGTVARICSGRWTPGDAVGDYPPPFTVDSGAGAQGCWGFTFDRDIEMPQDVLALPASDEDETPAKPYAQPGETGTLDTLTGTETDADSEDEDA